MIAEAFDKVGKDGVITVDESQTMGTELEFTEGMQFDKGYLSPYFVTDPERMEAVLEDPFILINSGKISSMTDLPLLEKVIGASGTLFVVAEDVDGEALSTLVVNKIRGTFTSVAVKAPAFGDRRKAMLEDIAILTGAKVVAPEVGLKLDQVGLDVLGRARRIVVTKDNTTIVDGAGEQRSQGRAWHSCRPRLRVRTPTGIELQERVAKLAGGVCVIKVGAATEVELKEKKHRIEDAVSATRAAIEEHRRRRWLGAIHAAAALDGNLGLSGDERLSVNIVRRALAEPLRWIAENGGEQGYVVTSMVAELEPGKGYNAVTNVYGDLYADGVIDPVKVTRSRWPMPRRSPRCCSPPRRWWWRSPRRRTRRSWALSKRRSGDEQLREEGPLLEGPLTSCCAWWLGEHPAQHGTYPLYLGCMPYTAATSHAAWDVRAVPGVHAMRSFDIPRSVGCTR